MTTRKPLILGPFSKGLNTYDDPTAIQDTELVEALNFDPGFDGSLRSRPPFTDTGDVMTLGATGSPRLVGYFYDTNGTPHLIASDGLSSTWRYSGGVWVLITSTFAATDMAQFDGKAWLLPPVGEADPGGYWTPVSGFVPDSDMPKGTSITSYKNRLWIAEGVGGNNPTRIRYSKVLGQPSFWASAAFMDVGAGDGQGVVKIISYFDTMLVFRTKSIWSFQYGVDPATAIQGVVVPGVGLQTSRALVAYESYLYFMYDEKAYQFINNRATQINIKVPFRAQNLGSTNDPFHVSLFNNRILYSYYELIYVYSLRTQTWTTWRSDAWGPIGQVMSSFVSGDTDEAFALPSYSPPSSTRTNVDTNPRAVSTAGRTYSIGGGGGTLTSATTPGMNVGGYGIDTFVRTEVTSPGTYVDVRNTSTNGILVGTGDIEVSAHLRPSSISGGTVTTFIQQYDGAGTLLGTSSLAGQTLLSGWNRYTYSAPRLSGVTRVVAIHRVIAAVGVGARLDATAFYVGAPGGYFDGSFTDTQTHDYGWSGTANASASTDTTIRSITLLHIEDRFSSDRELMECLLQTKNYNFDVPGSYKVLFWWGLDAIFRTNVTGQASPVVFNSVTMWGQILSGGNTWGDLRQHTWRFPLSEGETFITTEVVSASGPARKFVRFFKKFRFRQLFFRIRFQTDGSTATAPVQIFTISAYMAEKETVSKQIS